MDELNPGLLLQILYLVADQDRSRRVCGVSHAAGAAQNGAKALTLLQPIAAGAGDLALENDGRADVVPSRRLMNGENVSRLEMSRVEIFRADLNCRALADDLFATLNRVARQV